MSLLASRMASNVFYEALQQISGATRRASSSSGCSVLGLEHAAIVLRPCLAVQHNTHYMSLAALSPRAGPFNIPIPLSQ